MAMQDVINHLQNGGTFPLFTNGADVPFSIKRRQHYTTEILLQNTDHADITIQVNSVQGELRYRVSFFIIQNGSMFQNGTLISQEMRINFQKEIQAKTRTFMHIEVVSQGTEITGTFNIKLANYVPSPLIAARCYHGQAVSGDLNVRKPDRFCREAIEYEMIEGSLPSGLRMLPNGLIVGTVDNLDCMEYNDSVSPSFNWFADNHDSVAAAWGRIWRFKVKAFLVNQPHIAAEQWMCVKVYNNWDLDRDKFIDTPLVIVEESIRGVPVQETPKLIDVCPPCEPVKEFKPAKLDLSGLCGYKTQESGITVNGELIDVSKIRYDKLLDCDTCKDPTRQKDVEEYTIPLGTLIRVPEELLKFYILNKDNYDPLIMQLHSSKILPEIYENMNKEKVNRSNDYEISISKNKIKLIKYHATNGRSMDDTDERMLSIKNALNQRYPIDAYAWKGSFAWATLIW